jgi:polysaccharide deacetylase 2 family uncharacterized protein YibQ
MGMKGYKNPQGTLIFIAIAVMLMVIVHFVFTDTFKKTPYEPPVVKESAEEVSALPIVLSEADWSAIEEAFEEPYLEYESPVVEDGEKEAVAALDPQVEPEVEPEIEEEYALAPKAVKKTIEPFVLPDGSKPKIAIIIDDMGMNRTNGFRLIEMDAPLTLAFLPYAPHLDDITAAAQDAGHELMIHMPMEAMDGTQNLGGIALKKGMQAEAIEEQLGKAFESFDGYKGLNNHMGSRLTQDQAAMNVVMKALRKKDLYFVDSVTIGSSVAGQSAWDAGLRTAVRDVFLDHEDHIGFVRKALKKTENAAKRQGYAIAIGHPKNSTIQGLKEWLPTLEAKGFEIVHASALVRRDATAGLLAQEEKPLSKIEPAASAAADAEEDGKAEEAAAALVPDIDPSLPLQEPSRLLESGLGLY